MDTRATIRFGHYELDRAAEQLRRRREPIFLRPKAWRVLCHLAERPGQLVATNDLLDAAWPGTAVTPNALTNVIGELRKALDDTGDTPLVLETVHRRGYRFIAPVRSDEGATSRAAPPPPLSVQHATFSTALVGRDSDLAQLHTLWQRALAGDRQIVFVTGEAGIGKTTLVDAYVSALQQTPTAPHIARAACIEQQGSSEPYMPILDLIEQLGKDGATASFVELLRQHAPTWLAQISSLLPAADMTQLRTSLVGLGSQRMLREGAALFDTLAEAQPLLLVIEDLHGSDGGTLDLIAALAKRTNAARLMLLLTYRPVDAVVSQHRVASVALQLRQQRRACQLPLAPFNTDDVHAYLQHRFTGSDAAPRLVRTLERHSGGNPLFVGALVTHLIAQGSLREIDGAWELAPDAENRDVGLPEDIRSAIATQLAALPRPLLELLEAASVEGEEFTIHGVAAAVDRAREEVEDTLHEAVMRQQLIHAAGTRQWPRGDSSPIYRFNHVLYRRTVYESVAPSRRRQLHRRVGECLEGLYGNGAGEIAAQLVVHFEEADDIERRVRYRALAATIASMRFAHRDSVDNLNQALTQIRRLPRTPERLREQADLELQLGNAIMSARGGLDPLVHDAFTRAEALAREGGAARELFRALFGLAAISRVVAGVKAYEPFVNELLGLTATTIPSLAGQAHWQAGELNLGKGNLRLARVHLEQSLQLESEPNIPVLLESRSVAGMLLAATLTQLGFLEQGKRAADDALRHSAAAGRPFSDCHATWLAAVIADMQRDTALRVTLADQCAAKAELSGFVTFSTIGFWRLRTDTCDAAFFAKLMQENRTISGRWYDSLFFAVAAETVLGSGDIDAAQHFIAEGFAASAELGTRWPEAELWRLKGQALLQRAPKRPAKKQRKSPPDDAEREAEACFRSAIDIARQQEAKLWELRATTSLAHLLRQQGKRLEATSMLAEIVAWFSEGFEATDLRTAHALLDALNAEVRS